MATAGPYRVRLDQPVSIDGFMRELHRWRRFRRSLPAIIACLALTPAVAIALSAQGARTGEVRSELAHVIKRPAKDSWGFLISPDRIRPWWVLTRAAPRPTHEDSPYPAEQIQAAVFSLGPELRACYSRSPALAAKIDGELVASMLIAKGGKVTAVVGGADELRRAGVNECVGSVLNRLSFPGELDDYGWVHMPLRFEP